MEHEKREQERFEGSVFDRNRETKREKRSPKGFETYESVEYGLI